MQPVFNVTKFQGVTNIQMNEPMAKALRNLINEVDLQPQERHLVALHAALCHPEGSVRPERPERPSRNTRRDSGFGDSDNWDYGN